MGLGQTCSRIILSIVNGVFFLSSAVLLIFGIVLKAMAGDIPSLIPTIGSLLPNINIDITGLLSSVALFVIIIGLIGVVIAGFGLVGACCLIRWTLIMYASLMIALLLGAIALIIFANAFSDQFGTAIKGVMKNSLANFQDIMSTNGSSFTLPSDIISIAWTIVQVQKKCCGAFNYTDYAQITWKKSSDSASVPISCCSYNSTSILPISPNDFDNLIDCLQGNPAFINQQSCYDAVKKDLEGMMLLSSNLAIGVTVGILATGLILIVLSFIEYFTSRTKKE